MTLIIKLPRDAEPCGVFEFHTDRLEVRSLDGVFMIRQTDEGISLKAPDGSVTVIQARKPPRKAAAAEPSTRPVVVARPRPNKTKCPNCQRWHQP